MKARGVYVRESFAGLTELLAIDGDGRTVRQLTVATALHTSHDTREMWRFLDAVCPVVAATARPRRAAARS
jgi:hypothetical protein